MVIQPSHTGWVVQPGLRLALHPLLSIPSYSTLQPLQAVLFTLFS